MKFKKIFKRFKNDFNVRRRDVFVSTAILIIAYFACNFMFLKFGHRDQVPLVFVLAVLVVSRMTSGYTCGIIASFISVVCVNYVFTYPYFHIDFTLSGYPLTFVTMLAVSIIVSTLTTRVKLQEKIRLETEKEKLRANLLRAVSHDIRTPLTSIGGAASAIIENGDAISDDEKKRLLESIVDESQQLVRTVENLLSVTKINGDADIVKNDEIVEEVVSEAVTRFKKYHPGIEISVTIPEVLLFVPMDGLLIEQVLINLMDNAVTHGKTTTIINIEVTSTDNDALFSVADNGIGIDKKRLEEIPNSFSSLEGERTTDSKRNMGIGLSVCASIIKAHGGKFSYSNRPNGGAVFTFKIPLK